MGKPQGAAALTAVKLLRSRKDDARRVLPPELHHYLEDRIVVASWYPERDVFGLMKACAKLFPMEGAQFEAMGAQGKELTALAQKVTIETIEPIKEGMTSAFKKVP